MIVYEKGRWEMRVGCHACKSKLGVEANDVQYRLNRDYTGSSDPEYFVRCAVCNEYIKLNEMAIPDVVRQAARDRHIVGGSNG